MDDVNASLRQLIATCRTNAVSWEAARSLGGAAAMAAAARSRGMPDLRAVIALRDAQALPPAVADLLVTRAAAFSAGLLHSDTADPEDVGDGVERWAADDGARADLRRALDDAGTPDAIDPLLADAGVTAARFRALQPLAHRLDRPALLRYLLTRGTPLFPADLFELNDPS